MGPAGGESTVIPLPGVEHPLAVQAVGAQRARDSGEALPRTGPARLVVVDGRVTGVDAPTLDPSTVVGRALTDLVHPKDAPLLDGLLGTPPADGPALGTVQVRLGPAGGAQSYLELTVESRSPGGVVLRGWDVTAHVRRQQTLERLALHDPMTGLANRVLFDERLHDELRRRRRTRTDLAVMYADLDGFKSVNDTWGHRAGDLLLVAVSARLRSCLRPGDVLARLGGDEFGVCCPELTDPADALAVAHRLVEEATAPLNLGGAVVRVSVSVGVAMAGDDDVDDRGARLLARADLAMYAAKQTGKERVALAPAAP